MKKTKLISVISTIGVIGAIAPISTLATGCSHSNPLSEDDKAFLNSINAVVATLDFEGVPFKAVHAVKNAGFNLFEHKFSQSYYQLVLNMDGTKEYAVLWGNKLLTPTQIITNFNKNNVWKFVDKYDPTSEYAQHLNDNFKWDSNETLEITGPVDTGTNTNVKKIKYVGTTTAKTNYIRTYTEFLTIQPQADDTIHHFHYANNVYVNGTGSSHYLEYGRSCYLRAENTQLSFAQTQARDEPSTVDVFEPMGTNTVTIVGQDSDTNVYTQMGSGTTTGKTLTIKYPATTKTAQNIEQLAANIESSCIVKLTNDIKLTSATTLNIGSVGYQIVNIVLDLNGHTIDTTEVSSTNPLIQIYRGTFVLIDSKGPDSTAKITGNQHIAVTAEGTDDVARFILDGGQIEFTTNGTNASPAITVGSTTITPTSSETYRSEFYLYGGSVKSTNTITSSNIVAPAIQIQNQSSYIYTVYGDIYGTDGAIVTDPISTTTTTLGSQIEVFGGNLECDNKHICINLRRESELTVYGGSFTGGTCIGSVNSKLNLNGGLFNATGEFVEDFYNSTSQSLLSDGSVIACYWLNDNTNTTQPSVASNNVKMYSAKGLIFHLGSEVGVSSSSKAWIEFISGCYYWCGDAEKVKTWPAGMLIDNQTTFDKFQWLQKGLWTRR